MQMIHIHHLSSTVTRVLEKKTTNATSLSRISEGIPDNVHVSELLGQNLFVLPV